jgi:hypothetical protein
MRPRFCAAAEYQTVLPEESSSPRSLNARVKSWRNGRGLEDELKTL